MAICGIKAHGVVLHNMMLQVPMSQTSRLRWSEETKYTESAACYGIYAVDAKSTDIFENPKNKDVLDAVQGLSKRGMDLTYLGNGSSVLAVAGQCSQGGNIVIWDSHRPLTSGPVARLSYHMAAVTALKVPTSPFKLL